ncbi:MAG: transposase [Okeania sp. SIO3C4]|nr:transposase [Okeania sp. SIO3B3]NER02091.1 transposase [Okeania sp. SIO3C4]
MAKSVHDAGWGQFKTTLTNKTVSAAPPQEARAGQLIVEVKPHGTTVECSRCGLNEVRSQNSEVRSDFCNGDLSKAPKMFRLKRRGFRPVLF